MERTSRSISGQPIFHPVLDEAYAAQIARDWNPPDAASGFVDASTGLPVGIRPR